MLKLKLQYFGHLVWRTNLLEKTDAGKDWRQEEKGTTEDEMVGWHHRLDGHEFEHAPGVGDGQGGLACCGSWGCKESDTTEQLNCMNLGMFGAERGERWQHRFPNTCFCPGPPLLLRLSSRVNGRRMTLYKYFIALTPRASSDFWWQKLAKVQSCFSWVQMNLGLGAKASSVPHPGLSHGYLLLLLFCFIFFYILLFLFFSFIFISWRLITSQHCSGFCHSHGYLISPFVESSLLRASRC